MNTRKLGNSNLEVSAIELTPRDLHAIEAAAEIRVQGARYPERLEQMTGR